MTADTTYRIIGGDGKEYGPATLEELKSWISSGRVTGATQVSRSDLGAWAAAAQFAELQLAASPSPPPAAAPVSNLVGLQLAAQVKSGAGWFYWVAGLSAINTVAALSGSSWRLIVGLGISQIFDAIAIQAGPVGKTVAVVMDLMVLGLFILFGYFAARRHNWSFIVGMIVFGLDGLIFLLGQDWLSIAFHVYVLYCLFRGFQANRALKALENSTAN